MEDWLICEQVTQMVQEAVVVRVIGVRGRWYLAIIAPVAAIQRRRDRRKIAGLFCDEETADDLQKVRMLGIARIEQVGCTTHHVEPTQKYRLRFRPVFIAK